MLIKRKNLEGLISKWDLIKMNIQLQIKIKKTILNNLTVIAIHSLPNKIQKSVNKIKEDKKYLEEVLILRIKEDIKIMIIRRQINAL